jgi:hypothetical protein
MNKKSQPRTNFASPVAVKKDADSMEKCLCTPYVVMNVCSLKRSEIEMCKRKAFVPEGVFPSKRVILDMPACHVMSSPSW